MVTTAAQARAGVQLEHYRRSGITRPIPVWVHQDRILVYVNRAAMVAFAVHSADQIIGRSVFEFVADSSRELVDRRVQDILDGGERHP